MIIGVHMSGWVAQCVLLTLVSYSKTHGPANYTGDIPGIVLWLKKETSLLE